MWHAKWPIQWPRWKHTGEGLCAYGTFLPCEKNESWTRQKRRGISSELEKLSYKIFIQGQRTSSDLWISAELKDISREHEFLVNMSNSKSREGLVNK